MGLRKSRTRLTVIICLLSEILKNDSVRERVELKSPMRHTHLDMNGMEIDDEPEDSVATGELHETIVSGCQLMDVRPSFTTLTQARKMILTH